MSASKAMVRRADTERSDQEGLQAPDLARMKRYFTESEQLTQEARKNSLAAIDYYDSDQYTREEKLKLSERGQPALVINRLKAAINGIIGVTEKGRSDPKAWPRNPGDTDSADAATDVLRYIADFNRFKRVKQDCFKDLLVPGTTAALVGVDDDEQVTITQIRWEEFFYDARARRNDFRDARYLGIAKWLYADDVSAMYPEQASMVEATVENGAGGGIVPDQSFQDRPLNGPGTGGAWVDPKQRRLLVVEIYYREGGWKRCVYTGTGILEAGDSPYQDHKGRPDCPIEAMSAYVRRDNGRYGAAWDMIGPQDEINKRRSKALHLLSVSRIEAKDPSAINVDAAEARKEAARPDGVLPFGWGMSPNTAEFQGNVELMAEAKAELERMGPNPAVLGRDNNDASGRALLARQQSGLIELANLYGALEDWELRIYRQCWARAKQFWRAPQFIRVTDDDNAPKFVGLNQPVMGPPTVGLHPDTGQPALLQNVLGYKNAVAEMDVDIEVDAQPDIGTILQEAFNELLDLVKMSPVYQQQVTLKQLIMLSPIPHKRSVIDAIDQAGQQQQAQAAQKDQIAQAGAQAHIADMQASAQEKTARAGAHTAGAFAKVANALTEAHSMHADHAVVGLEAGIAHGSMPPPQPQAVTDAAAAQMQQQPGAGAPPGSTPGSGG